MRLTARVPRAMAAGLVAFSAAALAAGVGRAAVTAYLPVALERIRDAPGLIGLVMLVNVAAGFVTPLWVGIWSDRLRARGHGRTRPFILGGSILAAGGLAAVAAGTGTGYVALAAAALVAYVGLNAVTTAHRALIPETYGEDVRAAATGAEELAMLLGTTIGVAMGGVLVEWRIWAPFAAAAALVPLLAAPTVRWMRGRERTGEPVAGGGGRTPLRYYLAVATRPGVARLLLAQGLWVLGYAALPSFFVLYATKQLDLRPAAAGGMLVVFGVVSGGAMLLAGLEARPERQPPLLAVGVVLMGGGLLAMTPAGDAPAAAPGMLLAATGFGLLSALGFPVMSRYIPHGEAGAYTAVYLSVRSVGGALALPLAGGVIAATGAYRSLVAFGGVVTLLALVPLAPLAGMRVSLRGLAPPPRRAARAGAVLAAITLATAAAGLLVAETPLSRADHALYRLLNPSPFPEGALDALLVAPDVRNYALIAAGAWLAALVWRPGCATRTLVAVIASGLVAFLLVRVIWLVWERPRPEEVLGTDAVVGAHEWAPYPSFPSGHAAVWLAMAIAVAAVFPRLRLPLGALVAVVALTRVTAGAHFPSDVLGALVIGWASARAVAALLPPPDRPDGPSGGDDERAPDDAPALPVHPAERHPEP